MKRIGEIAARLVANPVELVAAANQKRSTRIEGGDRSPSKGREAENLSPMLEAGGGGPTEQTGMEKDGSGKAPASFNGSRVDSGRTNTPLTMSRNMDRGLPPMRSPSAPRSIFLVTIDGVRVHCPPAQAARSGSARASSPKANTMIQSLLSEREVIERHP